MNVLYDQYVALDWAQSNMAIARMTAKSNKITVFEGSADVGDLKTYLSQLQGKKVMTIEETTTTQWLYTELANYVDKIVVCDPYRNRLLSEGAKTDKIDASKLVQLLKANLLKEVYHSSHEFIYLRKIASGYEDLVKAGVRLKNQRHALIRAVGKVSKRGVTMEHPAEQFILERLEKRIEEYEYEKKEYEQKFRELGRIHKEIRHQRSLPGIDWINAVKVVSRVVSPYRFSKRGDYLSYCGLIKLEKISGGRSYGKKNSRYSRELKSVYKTAALAAISSDEQIGDYYSYLINEKNYPEYKARHAVARRIATLSFGVFKSLRRYEPKRIGMTTG